MGCSSPRGVATVKCISTDCHQAFKVIVCYAYVQRRAMGAFLTVYRTMPW